MDASKLRSAGRFAAALKKHVKTAGLLTGLANVPRITQEMFSHGGEQLTRAFAENPEAPGMAAKALGGLVTALPVAVPAAAIAVAGAKHYGPQIGPYLATKRQQFEADQLDQMPYYDTQTQRFV